MTRPVIGVVGYKNNGKTRLVNKIVAGFVERGLRVSTIKHTHHSVDLDRPGKDSHQHRMAGADEVIIASSARFAILHEYRDETELELEQLLDRIAPVDLVVVEGFKAHNHPKIEAHYSKSNTQLLAPNDPTIWAVATDQPRADLDCPVFNSTDIEPLLDFIADRLGLRP